MINEYLPRDLTFSQENQCCVPCGSGFFIASGSGYGSRVLMTKNRKKYS
jgi:hypothetical protein